VHLGQNNFPIEHARKLCPPGFIIGIPVHNVEQALHAETQGAGYVSVGCLFPIHSKKNVTLTSLEVLQEIKNAVHGVARRNTHLRCFLANTRGSSRTRMVAPVTGLREALTASIIFLLSEMHNRLINLTNC